MSALHTHASRRCDLTRRCVFFSTARPVTQSQPLSSRIAMRRWSLLHTSAFSIHLRLHPIPHRPSQRQPPSTRPQDRCANGSISDVDWVDVSLSRRHQSFHHHHLSLTCWRCSLARIARCLTTSHTMPEAHRAAASSDGRTLTALTRLLYYAAVSTPHSTPYCTARFSGRERWMTASARRRTWLRRLAHLDQPPAPLPSLPPP